MVCLTIFNESSLLSDAKKFDEMVVNYDLFHWSALSLYKLFTNKKIKF